MLLLCPSELGMLKLLEGKRITLVETEIAADKMKPIAPLLQSLCASDSELKYVSASLKLPEPAQAARMPCPSPVFGKLPAATTVSNRNLAPAGPTSRYLAQKCFMSYMRSVFLQGNKDVFDVEKLPVDEFAAALGLPSAPRIKFVKKQKAAKLRGPVADSSAGAPAVELKGKGKGKGKVPAAPAAADSDDSDASASSDESEGDSEGGAGEADDAAVRELRPARSKGNFDKLRVRQNVGVLAPHRAAMRAGDDDDDDDDLFVKSATQTHDGLPSDVDLKQPTSRKAIAKATTVAKARLLEPEESLHLKFGDDGSAVNEKERVVGVDVKDMKAIKAALKEEREHDLKAAARMLEREDVLDKEVARQRLREKKREKKRKLKAAVQTGTDGEGGYTVSLGGGGSDDDMGFMPSGDDDGDDGFDEKRPRTMQDDEDVAKQLLGL